VKFFIAFIFFVFGCFNSKASSVDTARLNYPIGGHSLSLKNKQTLSSIVDHLKTGDSVYVTGFADYLGEPESNMELSFKRAATVKTYLTSLNKKLVITIDGKGEIPPGRSVKSSLGNYKDRRVDIVISLKTFKEPKDSIRFNSVPKPKDSVINKNPMEKLKALSQITPGSFFSMDDLNFFPGRHFPTSRSYYYLENLLYFLAAHPTIEFEIQGHICCITGGGDGLDVDTQQWGLSATRAQFVYEYFLKRGISAARMSFKGLASNKPKVRPEITEDDRQLNRRVELLILKQ
jgi:outer membrane protein OmpA-like peptidoglycan-associated protein